MWTILKSNIVRSKWNWLMFKGESRRPKRLGKLITIVLDLLLWLKRPSIFERLCILKTVHFGPYSYTVIPNSSYTRNSVVNHVSKHVAKIVTYWCCITLTRANISKCPDLYCSIISATSKGSRQSLNFWRTVKNLSFWMKRFAREKRLIWVFKMFKTSFILDGWKISR